MDQNLKKSLHDLLGAAKKALCDDTTNTMGPNSIKFVKDTKEVIVNLTPNQRQTLGDLVVANAIALNVNPSASFVVSTGGYSKPITSAPIAGMIYRVTQERSGKNS